MIFLNVNGMMSNLVEIMDVIQKKNEPQMRFRNKVR